MTRQATTSSSATPDLDRLIIEIRPKLHRYCTRMIGSAIDGEDVVQEALQKALEAGNVGSIAQPRAWLFRIAHNTALDFLRRRAREEARLGDEDLTAAPDPLDEIGQRQAVAASLQTFMALPASQRSSVILKDVLGYSLEEVAGVMETTPLAVKANLHRGRQRLRELARGDDDCRPPAMTDEERALHAAYVHSFNARDFDAVRRLIAEDVRLDVVGRTRLRGRVEAGRYFGNYAARADWFLSVGSVEGRPAALVRRPENSAGAIAYFILLRFEGGQVAEIRDFRYAAYVVTDAEVTAVGQPSNGGTSPRVLHGLAPRAHGSARAREFSASSSVKIDRPRDGPRS